jgi:hypothetical protein
MKDLQVHNLIEILFSRFGDQTRGHHIAIIRNELDSVKGGMSECVEETAENW